MDPGFIKDVRKYGMIDVELGELDEYACQGDSRFHIPIVWLLAARLYVNVKMAFLSFA